MFDPVPSFNSEKSIEEVSQELLSFKKRIIDNCAKYNVDSKNRFTIIWDCCDLLEQEIDNNKGEIWEVTKTYGIEPIEKVQDLLQLLIYAIGDRGLLFQINGHFYENPNYDNWEESASFYMDYGYAIQKRYFSMLELVRARRVLDTHININSNYMNKEYKVSDMYKIIKSPLIKKDAKNRFLKLCENKIINEDIKQGKSDLREPIVNTLLPLYIFFKLYVNNDVYLSLGEFRSSLKRNKGRFNKNKLNQLTEDYNNICKIIREYANNSEQITRFNPYYVLISLRKEGKLRIDDINLIKISNICYNCFLDVSKMEDLKMFEHKIADIAIGDVIKAFKVIFDGQICDMEHDIKTKDIIRSIKMLYCSTFIEKVNDIPYGKSSYEYKELNAIKKAIIKKYGIDDINLSMEMFWLLTGYGPPINFSFSKLLKKSGLYELFNFDLKCIWNDIYFLINKHFSGYDGPVLPIDLALDISKVKQIILLKDGKNSELCRQVLKYIGFKDIKYLFDDLKDYCIEQYSTHNSNKTNFKSFSYARDIIECEIVKQYVEMAVMQMYSKVFSAIVKLSDCLWLIPDLDKI